MTLNSRPLSTSWVLVYLFLFCIAGPLSAADNAEPNFTPGEETNVNVDRKIFGIDNFMVYVPSDYNDNRDWPVIFFYHGMGGEPATGLFRYLTKGCGFIVIGMAYVPGSQSPMNEGQYISYIKRLRKSALEVKKYVAEHLRIDEKRLFITGCSMGGWYISSILESSPKAWAGVVILAAGRSRNIRLVAADVGRMAMRGKPIYIGAGERDANLAAARKAQAYYQRLGANVTFEQFQGVGHICDPPNRQKLYNWLISNSSVEDTQSGEKN
ncbi:MAG: prolyl oligopeptidase family serine peptidase [Phycisphaerae bacterium]|nr:prolyl oligopeptidase family serine peptidase [Phycisphaerae bacterium]MDD5380404.1 prolyl oligopeptidase family serine peptidase [Phycisphaerae bacterium]